MSFVKHQQFYFFNNVRVIQSHVSNTNLFILHCTEGIQAQNYLTETESQLQIS